MSRLQMAIEQIVFARQYTNRLLEQTPESDWFRQSAAGVSHIAWQVGHLAMAEYRLALDRTRGERPEDRDLIPPVYFTLFGRASEPVPEAAAYPPLAEIRAVFDRVHAQTLKELPGLNDADLDQPTLKPHAIAKTRLWSLLWCAHHESIHAGQIGLLRRQLGQPPLW